MEDMKKDYDELMGIKIKLDLEINTYRKILEGEEERLGMSPTGKDNIIYLLIINIFYHSKCFLNKGSPSATPAGRGVKRKRTTIVEEDVSELVTDHTGKGNVTIEPLDKDGKFVKLRNSSGSQINIGGWTLTNVTGGEDVAYKFHRSTTLEDGEVCTVWSSDTHEVTILVFKCGKQANLLFIYLQTHEPPLNLVMKKGGWEIGDENLTSIKSKDGEEEATRTSRRARTLSGSTRYGLSELHSYRGEEGGDSKCVVM
jgi:lamin B